MSRAAKAESVREQAGPIFARTQITSLGESGPPKILGPLLAVSIMSVAPKPRGQSLLFITLHWARGCSLVLVSFSRKKTFKSRAGQFSRIPRVIGADLRIAYISMR